MKSHNITHYCVSPEERALLNNGKCLCNDECKLKKIKGIYIFTGVGFDKYFTEKDAKKTIVKYLYIGRAVNMRTRMAQYFNGHSNTKREQELMHKFYGFCLDNNILLDLQVIYENEVNICYKLLECKFIVHFQPIFNIKGVSTL